MYTTSKNMHKTLKTLAAAVAAFGLAFAAQAAATKYWVGGESGDWRESTNWDPSGIPGNTDTLIWTNNVHVYLDRSTADARGTGNYSYCYHKASGCTVTVTVTNSVGELPKFIVNSMDVEAGGKWVIDNVAMDRRKSPFDFADGTIEFANGSSNILYTQSLESHIRGGLTGNATIVVVGAKRFSFNGSDNSAFTGRLVSQTTESNRGLLLNNSADETGIPSGSLQIDAGCYAYIGTHIGSYGIGELTGDGYLAVDDGTLGNDFEVAIGGKNTDFDCGVAFNRYTSGSKAAHVRKVGTGTMNYRINGGNKLYIANGGVSLVDSTRLPSSDITFCGGALCDTEMAALVDVSSKIKDSTSAIVVDITNDATFASMLADSNTAGLTKKGEGTLTLSKAPAYTGTTTVEGGILMLPTKGLTLNGALCANGGKVGFGEELSGGEETLLTWTTAGSSVTTADFAVEVELPLSLALVSDAEAGTTSLVVERQALTYTWTGAADNRWANAANWTVGGEATEHYPTANDNAAFNDEVATVVAIEPDMTAFASMTGTNLTKFAVLFTATDASYTVPTGMTTNQFVAAPPFESVWGEGICKAGARATSTYVWAGGNGAWNNAQNWKIGSAVTGVWPTTGDTASFTAAADGAVVTLASGIVISGATIAEGATITYDGASGMVDLEGDITGSGKLVLSNVGLYSTPTTSHNMINIETPIEVPEDSVATFRIDSVVIGDKNYGCGFTVTNKVTGAGMIESYSSGSKNTYQGLHLNGDGSEFEGTVKLYSNSNQQRDNHSLLPCASSSNAVWRLYVDNAPKNISDTPFDTRDSTYYLGALMYKMYTTNKNTEKNITYEIGALDQDSYILSIADKSGMGGRFGSNNNIDWIAPTATFTNGVNTYILSILGGGTVVLASTNDVPTGRILFARNGGTLKTAIVDGAKIDPSAKFTKCAAPICFDDEGEDYTWATAIAASNEGGLTKKGAGTLTLVEKPLYTGLTTVEAGTLVLTNGTVLGGGLCISNDAKVAVSSESLSTSPETLLTWNYVAEQPEVTLDDFTLTLTPPTWLAYAIVTNDTTVSLVTHRVAADYTFKGVDGGLWSDATNWTVSSTETPFVPSTNDTATINAAVTVTTAVGQVVKTLTLGDGAKLSFDLTGIAKNEQVTLFAVGAGETCPLTDANVLISGYDSDAYAVKYDTSDTTKISVGLYDKTRFVWTGDGDNTLFSNKVNWVYGATNGPAATTGPTANSTVVFPSSFTDGVTVTFDGNTAWQGIYFVLDCDVTFASDDNKTSTIYPWSITGEGSLSLANYITLQTVTYKSFSIANDVVVLPTQGEDPWKNCATIYLRGQAATCTFNGAIRGSGYLRLEGDINPNKHYYLKGDMSGFSGKLYTAYTENKDGETLTTHFYPASMDLGKATWEIAGRVYVEELTDAATMTVGALVGSATTARIYNETTYPITLAVGSDTDASSSVRLTGDGEYGAWTIKKVGTGRQAFTNTAMTNNIELVEGELMLPENTVAESVTYTGGKFVFAYNENWTVGTATNVMTMTSCTGTIARDNVVIEDIPATNDWTVDNATDPTKLAITITEDVTYIWTDGSGDKLWTTAGNWKLSNGHPASKSPESTDAVKLGEDAVVVVTPGQTFGTVSAEATSKLAVLFTAEGQTFDAPTGFAGEVVAAGPFEIDIETQQSKRIASSFEWNDAAEGDWGAVGNWTVNGLPTGALPTAIDEVVFDNDAVVTTTVNALVSNLVLNAKLTLANTGEKFLSIGDANNTYGATVAVDGTGSLALSNAYVRAGFSTVEIDVPIEICATTENKLDAVVTKINKTAYGYGFNVTNSISGSGDIVYTQSTGENNIGKGLSLSGDMSGYTGLITYVQGRNSRGGKYIYQQRTWDSLYPINNGENARWDIYTDSDYSSQLREKGNYFAQKDITYKFGALKLHLPKTKYDAGFQNNVTLEVGKLDEDSSIDYTWQSASGCGVNWIASTATWTQDAANQAFLNVTGGGNVYVTHTSTLPATLTFADKGGTLMVGYDMVEESEGVTNAVPVDPSAKIKESDAAICFDDQGTNATWATALENTNKGGFIKKGNGTLTLTEVPLYDGATTVKEGKILMPSSTTVTLGEKTQSNTVTIGEVEWLELKPADAAIETKVTGSDDALDVTVSQDWVASELVGKTDAEGNVYTQETASEALTNATLNANGLPAWQSYALGLEPSVATSLPFVTPQQTTSTSQLTLNLAGVAPKSSSETGTTVLYQIETSTTTNFTGDVSAATSDTTYTVDLPESGVRYYRVNIKFDQPTNND